MPDNQTSPAPDQTSSAPEVSAAAGERTPSTRAATNGSVNQAAAEPRGTVPMSHLGGARHAARPVYAAGLHHLHEKWLRDRVSRSGCRRARQPMRGFEDTYVDIVDYIVRDHPPHLGRPGHRLHLRHLRTRRAGCSTTEARGTASNRWSPARSKDQRLPRHAHYADEVIWAGNDEQGFATSHRALNIGHHTGAWRWGPPTGTKVNSWVIANCVDRRQRDLRGMGAVQHGRPAAPARHRRAGRGPGARQLGDAGIARRA